MPARNSFLLSVGSNVTGSLGFPNGRFADVNKASTWVSCLTAVGNKWNDQEGCGGPTTGGWNNTDIEIPYSRRVLAVFCGFSLRCFACHFRHECIVNDMFVRERIQHSVRLCVSGELFRHHSFYYSLGLTLSIVGKSQAMKSISAQRK
jgi:hypothetical protein